MDNNKENSSEFFETEINLEDLMLNSELDYSSYKNAIDYEPIDTVYRGATMVQGPLGLENDFFNEYDDKYLMSDDKILPIDIFSLHVEGEPLRFEFDSSIIFVPMAPVVILPTNFRCKKSAEEIVALISETLNTVGVSFELNTMNAEYNAVFVKGAVYTKFQLHIYNTDVNGNDLHNELCEKIVEAQRFCGDGFAFNSIFGEIKNAVLSDLNVTIPAVLNTSSASTCTIKSGSCSPRPLSMSSSTASLTALDDAIMAPLSEEEKCFYLEPIKKMMLPSASIESQVEGCRLLCDMISSNPNFHEQLISSGCVQILLRLSLSNNFLACQHAVVGLAELATTTPKSIKVIWEIINDDKSCNSFIDFLCNQLTDGPYYTETRRRLGAQLLVSMLEYTKTSPDAVSSDVAIDKLEKFRKHLSLVSDRIVSPRSLNKSAPSSLCTPKSPSFSRQSSENNHYSRFSGEPLQDTILEECANKIELRFAHENLNH